MKTKRRIIAYIATSADGYIARPDADVEWLNRQAGDLDHRSWTLARSTNSTFEKEFGYWVEARDRGNRR